MKCSLLILILVAAFTAVACAGATCAWDGIGDGFGQSAQHPSEWIVDWTPRWSPDGQHLVVNIWGEYGPGIYVVDLADSSIKRIFIEPEGVQNSPQVSDDGRIVFTDYIYRPRAGFVPEGSSPHHWKIGTADLDGVLLSQVSVPPPSPLGLNVFYPAWLPGTDRIVAVFDHGIDWEQTDIYEVNMDGHFRRLGVLEDLPVFRLGVEISPNGEHVAYYQPRLVHGASGAKATISRMDGSGNSVRAPFSGFYSDVSNIAWSSDSRQVFFATGGGLGGCEDNVNAKIWSMSADGSGIELVADIPLLEQITSLEPSPDGSAFALVTGGPLCGFHSPFGIWSNGQLRDLISPCCSAHDDMAGISWSPDGKRIAVIDNAGGVGGALRTVNPDGSDVRVLVHREADGTLAPGE